MKCIFILFFTLVFISCETSEITHHYPDNISNSNNEIESRGCGNIFVYQFLDSLKALTVKINAHEVKLTKKRQDVDLGTFNSDFKVVLEVSPNHPDSVYFNYCNDVAFRNTGTTIKYQAVSGQLSFSVSEDNPIKDPIWKTFYYVTVRIEDLHLLNKETNEKIIIDEVVFWNVGVGWLHG